jgi:hypothetical protein
MGFLRSVDLGLLVLGSVLSPWVMHGISLIREVYSVSFVGGTNSPPPFPHVRFERSVSTRFRYLKFKRVQVGHSPLG